MQSGKIILPEPGTLDDAVSAGQKPGEKAGNALLDIPAKKYELPPEQGNSMGIDNVLVDVPLESDPSVVVKVLTNAHDYAKRLLSRLDASAEELVAEFPDLGSIGLLTRVGAYRRVGEQAPHAAMLRDSIYLLAASQETDRQRGSPDPQVRDVACQTVRIVEEQFRQVDRQLPSALKSPHNQRGLYEQR